MTMFKEGLWVVFYRIMCIKVTIDSIFYNFITAHPLLALDGIIRLMLWFILLFLLSPLEVLIAAAVDLLKILDSPQYDELYNILILHGKTKAEAQSQYQQYKETLFEISNR